MLSQLWGKIQALLGASISPPTLGAITVLGGISGPFQSPFLQFWEIRLRFLIRADLGEAAQAQQVGLRNPAT